MILIVFFLLVRVLTANIVQNGVSVDSIYGLDIKQYNDLLAISSVEQYVYVYNFNNGWVLGDVLTDVEYDEDGEFGSSVDIVDDSILVGVVGKQRVYIYNFNGTNWERSYEFIPSVQYLNGRFGGKVKWGDANNMFFVSHVGGNVFGTQRAGSVERYEFLGYGWDRVQSIVPNMYTSDMGFGTDIDYSNDMLLVSSGVNKVYVFEPNGFNTVFVQTNLIENVNEVGFGRMVRVTPTHIFVVSRNRIFSYTRYNMRLVQTIYSIDEINTVSVNGYYMVYTTTGDRTVLMKFMQNTYFGIVNVFESTTTSYIEDYLFVKVNYNEFGVYDNLNYTDAPTPSPTQYPTSVPTTSPVKSGGLVDEHMVNIVLVASILIPIVIFVIGLKFGKVC